MNHSNATNTIDWAKMGYELRDSALDAHDGILPHLDIAWAFLRENPECFGFEEWPVDIPADAPPELAAAYFGN